MKICFTPVPLADYISSHFRLILSIATLRSNAYKYQHTWNSVKTATEVEVRTIQDHKVIEWNICWEYMLQIMATVA